MAATNETGGAGTFGSISSGGSRNFTVDAGTGANRVLYVLAIWYRNTNRMLTASLTYNGVSLTSLGAAFEVGASENVCELFRLVAPASGSNTLTITAASWGGGGTSTDCTVLWGVAQDADQTTPESDYTVAQGTATGVPTASITIPSATDDLAVVFALNASSDVSYSAAGLTNLTANANTTGVGAYGYGLIAGYTAGASPNVNPSATWTTGMGGAATNEWAMVGVSVNPVASGGPAAGVVRAYRRAHLLLRD